MKALSEPGMTAEHRAIVLVKVGPLIEEGHAEWQRAGRYK